MFGWSQSSENTSAKGQKILAKTIKAHGGKKYDQSGYEFVFRKKTFTFYNNYKDFRYTSTLNKDGKTIVDELNNFEFLRKENGSLADLTEKQVSGYSNSLNSVIYFATLPNKLKDPSVNVKYKGTASAKGKQYEVLEITFDQEGGGKDHDDVFHYWINSKTNYIDYLAYNYSTGKGGVRFRAAFNPRTVDGIRFQDYINYKAPVGTPLADLLGMYEREELDELSKILTEDVKVLEMN